MKRERDDTEQEEDTEPTKHFKTDADQTTSCPYLGTIDRSRLDFDFEKVCSVSMQSNNVYACLVCGKYFQGRGRSSQAYTHSLQAGHHVFLNLTSKRFYCLPDGYEVVDSSLDDIKGVLDPSYTDDQVASLDALAPKCRTLEGQSYTQGVIGINNLKFNDYINVILQGLGHLSHFRNYFLQSSNISIYEKSELAKRWGVMLRKMWFAQNYRNHLSPHELLQEVSKRSGKKFRIGERASPVHFLVWFLNTLNKDMGGGKKRKSIVQECFEGEVLIRSEKEEKILKKRPIGDKNMDEEEPEFETRITRNTTHQPFFYLTLDMPPPPLFRDEKATIPQEPLHNLLSKFDGQTKLYTAQTKEYKTYKITKLPKYLIFHINRFTNNLWATEKNRTIVTFPIKGLEMRPFTDIPAEELACTRYNLVANIRHNENRKELIDQGDTGFYNVHVLHKATDKWYDIQDLMIEEALPPLIALSEAYIQIYELDETPSKGFVVAPKSVEDTVMQEGGQ